MKNLRELFTLYPLGCESFGAEWLRRWEALGKLLRSPCKAVERIGKSYAADYNFTSVSSAFKWCRCRHRTMRGYHAIVLLDGTVVYEWGPK